jgi:hypothetical protein
MPPRRPARRAGTIRGSVGASRYGASPPPASRGGRAARPAATDPMAHHRDRAMRCSVPCAGTGRLPPWARRWRAPHPPCQAWGPSGRARPSVLASVSPSGDGFSPGGGTGPRPCARPLRFLRVRRGRSVSLRGTEAPRAGRRFFRSSHRRLSGASCPPRLRPVDWAFAVYNPCPRCFTWRPEAGPGRARRCRTTGERRRVRNRPRNRIPDDVVTGRQGSTDDPFPGRCAIRATFKYWRFRRAVSATRDGRQRPLAQPSFGGSGMGSRAPVGPSRM